MHNSVTTCCLLNFFFWDANCLVYYVTVRQKIGPFAQPDFIQEAPSLPKTRSGKIMRRVLRQIAVGNRNLGDISTMADESVVDLLFSLRPENAWTCVQSGGYNAMVIKSMNVVSYMWIFCGERLISGTQFHRNYLLCVIALAILSSNANRIPCQKGCNKYCFCSEVCHISQF